MEAYDAKVEWILIRKGKSKDNFGRVDDQDSIADALREKLGQG